MPGGFYPVSNIQDCVKHIIKKQEKLPTTSPIHIYINMINNRLVFKIKDGYKLELQTTESTKLFGSPSKWIDKTMNREKAVLAQCNLVGSQYQQ